MLENSAPLTSRPGLSHRRGWIRDAFEIVALIVIIYTLVNLSTARAIVEGPSMQPNFYTDQRLIINRLAYYFSKPQRGDVVVLNNPLVSCADDIKNRPAIPLPFVNQDQGRSECVCRADLHRRSSGARALC